MTRARQAIVNADDFGMSDGVNLGIIEAHEQGIVTSASLMVRGPAAAAAAALASERPSLGLGLHVDLGEWSYHDGDWSRVYSVVDLDDSAAVSAEVRRQVEAFEALTGRQPDHLDSHQHVHLSDPVSAEVIAAAARELDIGLRQRHPAVAYVALYGQDRHGRSLPDAISPDAWIAALRQLGPGITEVACHPGHPEELASDYAAERAIELASLCDPAVRAAVQAEAIVLTTWRGLGFGDRVAETARA